MSESAPKYTPEQIARLEKSRTISDAELLKGGAEYMVDEEGNKVLKVADKDIDSINSKHESEIEVERQRLLYEYVQQEGIKHGDKVKIKFLPDKVSELGWSYISPELMRHGIKTGDERIFYIADNAEFRDCIVAFTVPIEQLKGQTEKEVKENTVTIWYSYMESVEKI